MYFLLILVIGKFTTGTGTSNYMYHLKNVHDIGSKEDAGCSIASFLTKKKEIPTNFKVFLWAIQKDISFNAICSDDFRNICGCVKHFPSRQTITSKYMTLVFNTTKEYTKELIKKSNLSFFTISLDSWTDNFARNGYTAFTLHFFDHEYQYHVVSVIF